MIKKVAFSLAAGLLAISATPAVAQDEPEDPRITYQLRFLKRVPGGEARWNELSEKYWGPARVAAGLPPINVHWLMKGEYDVLLPMVLPHGMATLDKHTDPDGPAFNKAFVELAGGEEEAVKIREESMSLVSASMSIYSHGHL